jgi:hypothetical protein
MTLADAAAAREAAGALRIRAEGVAAVANRLRREIDLLSFAGPAADRLRDVTSERSRRALAVAGDLEAAAVELVRMAELAEAAGSDET